MSGRPLTRVAAAEAAAADERAILDDELGLIRQDLPQIRVTRGRCAASSRRQPSATIAESAASASGAVSTGAALSARVGPVGGWASARLTCPVVIVGTPRQSPAQPAAAPASVEVAADAALDDYVVTAAAAVAAAMDRPQSRARSSSPATSRLCLVT